MARLEVDEIVMIDPDERLLPWFVSWSGVFAGAMVALALLLVFGLTAIAVGAHQIGQHFASWHEFRLITLAFSVFGSFLSFVLGGWVAARVTGTRKAEAAMLHAGAGPPCSSRWLESRRRRIARTVSGLASCDRRRAAIR